ncbi:MAG TPA: SDR family NAD(P)-dependent oxidoreductase [Candidatus Ozemobacteraceae bacterium]|nr:SDR family NAD(P)-dependent oxidoreductase [Candidatus Ozemobacteraceae bacterium]
MSSSDKIALIGMGIRFPGADTVSRFWENIVSGICSVKRFTRDELIAAGIEPALADDPAYVPAKGALDGIDQFDRAFFGYSPGEAAMIDPQHRLFLETAWEALEAAGYDPFRFEGRIGVYAGSGMNTYLPRVLAPAVDLQDTATLYQSMIGNDKDFLATRVAYLLNLRGPAFAVQCACSTSLVAIHLACQSLLAHECDMALAGGVTIRVPVAEGYLWNDGMILSPDGVCRPFDAAAAGTVPGSGAGVVLLKRYDEAIAAGDPVRCVILGSAINNDGSAKVGYAAPSVAGQVEVIAEAHAVAGVGADTIGYVECHGTGTPMGDPIEIEALTEAFAESADGRGRCAIGAVKANIGHCDTAAGVAGFIKAALAVEQGIIPPLANFRQPNAAIDFSATPFYITTESRPWPGDGPRRAGVSAFGIGGTNAHVVLEQPPASPDTAHDGEPHLLVLSAKNDAALAAQSVRLADALDNERLPLADVAHTLATGRARFERRRSIVAADAPEAAARLREAPPPTVEGPRRLVFMFPGQGAQYPRMGQALYAREPVYRNAFDQAAALFLKQGIDVARLLEGEAAALNETGATQPALFTVEFALAKLWMSWGAAPDAMIGHSIGEFVAATLAGVMSLADAVLLVARRAALMQAAPPGVMLSLAADETTARRIAESTDLDVAVINGPKSVVLAGGEEAVARAEARAVEAGIATRRLKTSHAFHSRSMADAAARLVEAAAGIRFAAPAIPYISNTTGRFARHIDAAAWGAHLRACVRFADGIAEIARSGPAVFVEIGPGETLSKLAAASAGRDHRFVASLPGPNDDRSPVRTTLEAFGACWSAGGTIDPALLYPGKHLRTVSLPTYPFQRVRCWADGKSQAIAPAPPTRRQVADWFLFRGWRQVIHDAGKPHAGPWLVIANEPRAAAASRWFADHGCETTAGPSPSAILLVEPDFATVVSTAARFPDGPRSLVAIVRNGAALIDSDRLDPDAAMTIAALRVVAQERPGWHVAILEIGNAEPDSTHVSAASRLAAEPNAPLLSAWRGGRQWEEEFRPAPIRGNRSFAISDNQVWLVTGGPGPVASALAEALAGQAKVRIAFVSRSGKSTGIDRLMALGATVTCHAADVADREALAAVWRSIESEQGPISGVIHAAGITGPQSFALLEEAAAGFSQFAAKIDGTRNIASLAGGVARVILVSSTASVLGGVGRIVYAAANAWMDAFALARNDGRWTSIGWDAWSAGPAGAGWESWAIDPAGGREAFLTILTGSPHPSVFVAPTGLDRRKSLPITPVATKTAQPLSVGSQALAGKIAEAWASVLGLETVAGDDDFFALGGDSLMATRALSRMKSAYGIDASMALFFSAPTPAGLAAALENVGTAPAGRERVTL